MKSIVYRLFLAVSLVSPFAVANESTEVSPEISIAENFLKRFQSDAARAIRLAKKECVEAALELGPTLALANVETTGPMRYTYTFEIQDENNKNRGNLSIKRRKGPKKFTVFYDCKVTPS